MIDDTFILWARNKVEQRHGKLEEATNKRIERQRLIERIRSCQENGKIAIVESGRDCDGMQYSGSVCLIDASVAAWDAHYDYVANHADGPFSFAVEKPSIAKHIKHTSRDLTLEAFEDGHPHVIYG
jgi:hypothetical protein